MTNDTTRREIVDGLNQFADTCERAAAIYDAISTSPLAQLMRHAEQATKHAPKFDVNSPAFAPSRRVGQYARDLERLASLKPTRWSPDFN